LDCIEITGAGIPGKKTLSLFATGRLDEHDLETSAYSVISLLPIETAKCELHRMILRMDIKHVRTQVEYLIVVLQMLQAEKKYLQQS
jgi:hypothetical protein